MRRAQLRAKCALLCLVAVERRVIPMLMHWRFNLLYRDHHMNLAPHKYVFLSLDLGCIKLGWEMQENISETAGTFPPSPQQGIPVPYGFYGMISTCAAFDTKSKGLNRR